MEGGLVSFFIFAFVSLFTIINPFSTASVFHTISAKNTSKEKRYMAKRAVITAVIVLLLFLFFGNYILEFFGITLPAFKIAGGLLIFGVGYKMVKSGKEHFSSDKEENHAVDKDDVSIIPLAIPMLSGPGAMATTMVLKGEAGVNYSFVGSIVVAILLVCFIAYILLLNANRIDRYFGEIGVKVTDKILGLIVLVIGVQFVIDGIGSLVSLWFPA